jgi:arginine-tRNA-protein transferase
VESFTILLPPDRCAYLPDRVRQLRCVLSRDLSREDYMPQLERGWRRFGAAVFRPECPSCQACQPLRVPVEGFRPNQSQRRAWNANADLQIRVASPTDSPDKRDLFDRFHRFQSDTKGWPTPEGGLDLFLNNPFPTEEWSYWSGDRLLATGYVDAVAIGLSAIYFFYDPGERRRSLGTFNVLALVAAARDRRLPHVYLGYYVEGCRSMAYKARFTPNEILSDGKWTRG